MSYYNYQNQPTRTPPPASAPPAPPMDDSFGNSRPFPTNAVDLNEFSYQTPYGRPGLVPKTSEDYGLSSTGFRDSRDSGIQKPPLTISSSGRVLHNGEHLPTMRGDSSLRPNTGNSNQSAGDPLGSLQEITTFLRWTTIISTCAAIVWEFFAFPPRLIGVLFLGDPSQVVLGCYLFIFSLLVLGAEFNNPDLKDNFGFLYYPLSRGMILLLMSGMCLGILKLWWEVLLGLAFGACGIGYIYTYIKYPEYRRWNHYNERMPTAWQQGKMYWQGESSIRTAAWADPRKNSMVTPTAAAAAQAAMGGFTDSSETQSLLYT